MIRLKHHGRTAFTIFGLLVLCSGYAMAEDSPPDDWYPRSEFAGQFDWIQMRSGEWVKGRIIARSGHHRSSTSGCCRTEAPWASW
jgi:hypothetical protein